MSHSSLVRSEGSAISASGLTLRSKVSMRSLTATFSFAMHEASQGAVHPSQGTGSGMRRDATSALSNHTERRSPAGSIEGHAALHGASSHRRHLIMSDLLICSRMIMSSPSSDIYRIDRLFEYLLRVRSVDIQTLCRYQPVILNAVEILGESPYISEPELFGTECASRRRYIVEV